MTTIHKLRTPARELAGEAWDYERRSLPAQAHVRRLAAKAVMSQANSIQREDAFFEDPPIGAGRSPGRSDSLAIPQTLAAESAKPLSRIVGRRRPRSTGVAPGVGNMGGDMETAVPP